MDTITAYQRTAALKAAIELDLFTAIAEGSRDPEHLARRCAASVRGLRILCDYLTAAGFLEKEGRAYRLTRDSAVFLDRRSPAYLGSIQEFLTDPGLIDGFLRAPVGYVRNGGSLGPANIAPDNPVWVKFARAMMPFMAPLAPALVSLVSQTRPTPPRKVLDIAAGHGLFGLAFASADPRTEVVAVDWAPVLQVARENAVAAGVDKQLTLRPGSAFDVEYGSGYDLVLLANFLHHFDPDTCIALLRKVRAALAEGGQVLLLEFVPNEDRISPPSPAMFAFVMLASTPAGDTFTYPELDRMLREAGFTRTVLHPMPPTPQSVVIADR